MKLEWLLAIRYLKSRKKNKILSFLSITSIVGIMLGVATLITVVSVMSGFSNNLKSKLLGANSDIVITRLDGKVIDSYMLVWSNIKLTDGVKASSPFISGQVLFSANNNVTGGVVKGISTNNEINVSSLNKYLIDIDIKKLDSTNTKSPWIILGKDLGRNLGVSPGDEVTLISPTGNRGPFGITPKMRKFTVLGYFDTGIHEYNLTMSYISLKSAQSFFNMYGKVTGFSVRSKLNNLDTVVNNLTENLRLPFWVRDWLSMNKNLFSALKLEQYAMFIILTLIIIVASFNIVSMIAITVKDKRRDIAILRAYGASSSLVTKVFINQGLVVGITGTILGDILALIISLILKTFKIIDIPEDIYFMDKIPVDIDPLVYIMVTVCSIIITFLAAIFPSKQAAKMSPIDVLRND